MKAFDGSPKVRRPFFLFVYSLVLSWLRVTSSRSSQWSLAQSLAAMLSFTLIQRRRLRTVGRRFTNDKREQENSMTIQVVRLIDFFDRFRDPFLDRLLFILAVGTYAVPTSTTIITLTFTCCFPGCMPSSCLLVLFTRSSLDRALASVWSTWCFSWAPSLTGCQGLPWYGST